MSLSSNINQLATRIGTEMAGQHSRIAALEGAAPIQIEGRVTALETAMAMLEAQRKLSIGCPKFWRSTTLPANHAYPDGSLIKFADWPEFKAVYDAGGFAGMLMPWNANAATQAANLGKFRPNAANPTGLYLPLHGSQFLRAWVLGESREAGSWGRDEIRNVTGTIQRVGSGHNMVITTAGALKASRVASQYFAAGENGNASDVTLDASRVVPTGPQNVPQHVWQPVIIYLGRPA